LSQSSREKLMKEYRGGEVKELEVYNKESFQAKLLVHVTEQPSVEFDKLIKGMKYEKDALTIDMIKDAIEQKNKDKFDKLLKLEGANELIVVNCETADSLLLHALNVNDVYAFEQMCNITKMPINLYYVGKSILRSICEKADKSKTFLDIFLKFKRGFGEYTGVDEHAILNIEKVGLSRKDYIGYEGDDNKYNLKLILTLCLSGLINTDTKQTFLDKVNIISHEKHNNYKIQSCRLLECLLACSMYGLLEWVKIISPILKDEINWTVNAEELDKKAWEGGNYYYNALHLACVNGHVGIVKYFLELETIQVNSFQKKYSTQKTLSDDAYKDIIMKTNDELIDLQITMINDRKYFINATKQQQSTPIKTQSIMPSLPRLNVWDNQLTPLYAVVYIPNEKKTKNHYDIIESLLLHKDINDIQSFQIGLLYGYLNDKFKIIKKMYDENHIDETKRLLLLYNNKIDGDTTMYYALQFSIKRIGMKNFLQITELLMDIYDSKKLKYKYFDETEQMLAGINACNKTPLYLASLNAKVTPDILVRLINSIQGSRSDTANEYHEVSSPGAPAVKIKCTIMDNLLETFKDKDDYKRVIDALKKKGGIKYSEYGTEMFKEAGRNVEKSFTKLGRGIASTFVSTTANK